MGGAGVGMRGVGAANAKAGGEEGYWAVVGVRAGLGIIGLSAALFHLPFDAQRVRMRWDAFIAAVGDTCARGTSCPRVMDTARVKMNRSCVVFGVVSGGVVLESVGKRFECACVPVGRSVIEGGGRGKAEGRKRKWW